MPRPLTTEDDAVIETWTIATQGTVWVWVYDRRNDVYIKQQCGAHEGSKMLHVSRDDRKYNQELIPFENQHLDPFTNGTLRLLGGATRDESLDVRYHLSDEELVEMFNVRDLEMFEDAIRGIGSEVVLRRIEMLSESHATQRQGDFVRGLLRERYPIGGTQRTVRDMLAEEEKLATRF